MPSEQQLSSTLAGHLPRACNFVGWLEIELRRDVPAFSFPRGKARPCQIWLVLGAFRASAHCTSVSEATPEGCSHMGSSSDPAACLCSSPELKLYDLFSQANCNPPIEPLLAFDDCAVPVALVSMKCLKNDISLPARSVTVYWLLLWCPVLPALSCSSPDAISERAMLILSLLHSSCMHPDAHADLSCHPGCLRFNIACGY